MECLGDFDAPLQTQTLRFQPDSLLCELDSAPEFALTQGLACNDSSIAPWNNMLELDTLGAGDGCAAIETFRLDDDSLGATACRESSKGFGQRTPSWCQLQAGLLKQEAASHMDCASEVDDTDSSGAGSGKDSATHHEDGDDSSNGSAAEGAKAPEQTQGFFRNLSTGSLPETARAHPLSSVPDLCKLEHLDIDDAFGPAWLRSHTSAHPLSNHCPGATNIELLETADDIPAASLLVGSGSRQQPAPGTQRMADITSINSSWKVVEPSGIMGGRGSMMHSSFMIPAPEGSVWADTSDGMSEHHHDNGSIGAWSSAITGAGGRPDLRPTRSMPNFTAARGGVARSPSELTSADAEAAHIGDGGAEGNRRVIIHRWPSTSSGRRSRDGNTGAGLNMGCPSSNGSLAELGSPLSSAPSASTFAAPQRVLPQRDRAASVRVATRSTAGGNLAQDAAAAAPRHGHNLRGRGGVTQAAAPEGTAPAAPGGGQWAAAAPRGPPVGVPPSAVQAQTVGAAMGVPPARTSRLPEVPPPQTQAGRKRASGGTGSTCAKPVPHPTGQCCSACSTTVTPVWRAGPQGPKTLCNACGVRYMKVAKRR